jgi:periplasmic protein TonB
VACPTPKFSLRSAEKPTTDPAGRPAAFGKGFASSDYAFMSITEVYAPREIAKAAGVPEERVVAALGSRDVFVSHSDAVRLGRELRRNVATTSGVVVASAPAMSLGASFRRTAPLFSIFGSDVHARRATGMPLAVSSTVHAGLLAAIVFITTFGVTPTATSVQLDQQPSESMRLVYLLAPGPGGGGGGGGTRQKLPPPKALRKGASKISSPMPVRRPPPPIEPVERPPDPPPPPPPLNSEPLPVVVAPIVQAPADGRDRIGVLQESPAEAPSRGPGTGGGVGTGTGTGIGQGDGSGVGPGSGGGTGGGPFRPGSGIEAPRLLREVKADYTEDARRRNVEGEVVLEIVVRRDGTVGDVKIVQRLGAGLDDRAVQAVRQWRFAPARRMGSPVDVIVEVAVEFKLR